MWGQLSNEQKEGFRYAAQQRNDYYAANNIATRVNSQDIALERLREIGDKLAAEVDAKLWINVRASVPANARGQLRAQYNVPPVIRPENENL